MKKQIFVFCLTGLLGTALLSGCQPKVTQQPTSIDSILVNRHDKLMSEDSLSPACELSIHLKYLTPEDSINQLINAEIVRIAFDIKGVTPQAAVDSFTHTYLRKYHNDLIPFYKQEPEGAWYNYTYMLTTRADNSQANILNYEIENDVYEGGAHGSHIITFLNFDKTNGHLLTLADLFAEGYEEPLTQRLLKALMTKLNANSLEELQEAGYLTMNDMYPTQNFRLTADGILFHYNAYEIAPYSVGATQLKLSLDELTDLLKPTATNN